MAESRGVWGIDIGQAGLKALRLRYADAAEQVIAVAFDYVPHPKILSQPDAIPEELIPQALEKFLSRNEVAGDAIAISVPGQTALARFIQLPPVESRKVAEIVKYEARQQIPFALEDVIWDYQTLGSGVEESGYMLEAEVGLFAMKRDQVMQQLRPFNDAKVEVELIQIAPLALYNVLSYDQMGARLGDEVESADEYVILLDMGADNTTLLVSNGEKIWIRNVPIGGNHFTRALTKEMKLTFAKAEHLKCNATRSPDPRAVFQALRPVFNDYVSEIQRSIGYFSSVNRDARITKVIGLGNGFKLAGLQKFLHQNLQYGVERLDTYQALVGDAVLNAPLFQENVLSFAVPYGLALQALDLTRIHTTLLPPEIATARKIRQKKPWAVVTAATLLFGFSLSAAGYSNVLSSVSQKRWDGAIKKVDDFKSEVKKFEDALSAADGENKRIKAEGENLIRNLDAREYWLEVYKAINECLPRDIDDNQDETDITKRNRIKLTSITAKRETDLANWFDKLRVANIELMSASDQKNGPTGKGYVFTLKGLHHHEDKSDETGGGTFWVQKTLLKNLQSWMVQHKDGSPVPVGQIGISHATITYTPLPTTRDYYPSGKKPKTSRGRRQPRGFGGGEAAARGFGPRGKFQRGAGIRGRMQVRLNKRDEKEPEVIKIPESAFTIQFAWRPIPKSERTEQVPGDAGQANKPAKDAAAPTSGNGKNGENKADQNAPQTQ